MPATEGGQSPLYRPPSALAAPPPGHTPPHPPPTLPPPLFITLPQTPLHPSHPMSDVGISNGSISF